MSVLSMSACVLDESERFCPSSNPGIGEGAQFVQCGEAVMAVSGAAVAGGPRGCAFASHEIDGLRVHVFDADGAGASLLVVAAEGDHYLDIGPLAIGFDGTQFVLAWEQKQRSGYDSWLGDDLFALRIGVDGAPIGDPVVLATSTLDDFCTSFSTGPQVARFGGGAIVAWGQHTATSCDVNGSVLARTIDDDTRAPSLTLSNPVELTPDLWRFALTGGAGGAVLAWHDVNGPLLAQPFDLQLTPIGEWITLDDLPDDTTPVAAGEPGRFAVAWDAYNGGLERDIRAVVFDGALGPIQELGAGGYPRVSAVPQFIAAWNVVRWIDDCEFAWDGVSATLSRDDHGEVLPIR